VSSHKRELEYFNSTLDVGRRLQRDIQRIARKIKPTKPDYHLSYFFFSKALKSLGATRLLWASGFFQDALVISRCIFEAGVLDVYIRRDRVRLTDKYLAYDTAARHNLSVGMARSLKNRRDKPWLEWKAAAARYGRAVKNLPYEFADARGWSGKLLRDIVRVLDKDGAQGIWTAYEFFYGIGSAMAHSSSQSMQEYLRQPYRTSYKQHGQRRAYLRDLPMLACRWCLIIGFLSAQDHFRIDKEFIPGDAIFDAVHLFRSLIHALGEELKDFDSEFFS
jgi:Family of unknown function (DUF5677)